MDAETLGIVLGVAGVGIGLAGIAVGEYRARDGQRQLEDLPQRTAENVARVLRSLPAAPTETPQDGAGPIGAYAGYADVDNDGEKELVVQHPAGVHGMKFSFYDWGGSGYEVVGETGSGTPTSARIGDFDGDGLIEIATLQTDWSAGRAYVDAPSEEWFFRWNGREFADVGRGERWDPMEGDAPSWIRTYFEPPDWAL